MSSTQQLKQELATYKKIKNKLLTKAKGNFVLIKGNKVFGTFNSYNDALTDGYKRFGNTPFLVKQVIEVEEVNYFTRPIV